MNLQEISPESKNWKEYLMVSAIYFKESWPEHFLEDYDAISLDYEKMLKERIAQGGRFLFAWPNSKEEIIGVTNCYTESTEKGDVLNIAEFYIKPDHRGRSEGSKFLSSLLSSERLSRVVEIRAEVDTNNKLGNKFWGSGKLGFVLDNEMSERNVYIKGNLND